MHKKFIKVISKKLSTSKQTTWNGPCRGHICDDITIKLTDTALNSFASYSYVWKYEYIFMYIHTFGLMMTIYTFHLSRMCWRLISVTQSYELSAIVWAKCLGAKLVCFIFQLWLFEHICVLRRPISHVNKNINSCDRLKNFTWLLTRFNYTERKYIFLKEIFLIIIGDKIYFIV